MAGWDSLADVLRSNSAEEEERKRKEEERAKMAEVMRAVQQRPQQGPQPDVPDPWTRPMFPSAQQQQQRAPMAEQNPPSDPFAGLSSGPRPDTSTPSIGMSQQQDDTQNYQQPQQEQHSNPRTPPFLAPRPILPGVNERNPNVTFNPHLGPPAQPGYNPLPQQAMQQHQWPNQPSYNPLPHEDPDVLRQRMLYGQPKPIEDRIGDVAQQYQDDTQRQRVDDTASLVQGLGLQPPKPDQTNAFDDWYKSTPAYQYADEKSKDRWAHTPSLTEDVQGTSDFGKMLGYGTPMGPQLGAMAGAQLGAVVHGIRSTDWGNRLINGGQDVLDQTFQVPGQVVANEPWLDGVSPSELITPVAQGYANNIKRVLKYKGDLATGSPFPGGSGVNPMVPGQSNPYAPDTFTGAVFKFLGGQLGKTQDLRKRVAEQVAAGNTQANLALRNLPSGYDAGEATLDNLVNKDQKVQDLINQANTLRHTDPVHAGDLFLQAKNLRAMTNADFVDQQMNPIAELGYGIGFDVTSPVIGAAVHLLGAVPEAMALAKAQGMIPKTEAEAVAALRLAGQQGTTLRSALVEGSAKAAEQYKGIVAPFQGVGERVAEATKLFARTKDSKAALDTDVLWSGLGRIFSGAVTKEDYVKILDTLTTNPAQLIQGMAMSPEMTEMMGGADGLVRWGKSVGSKDFVQRLPILGMIKDEVGELKSLTNAAGRVNKYEFLAELNGHVVDAARRANGASLPKALPFGAAKVELMTLGPNSGAVAYLDGKGNVIQQGVESSLIDAQRRVNEINKLVKTGGKGAGDIAYRILKAPTDIQRAFQSDIWLAMRPENWKANALGGSAMLFANDAYTLTPNRVAQDWFAAKGLPAMPTRAMAESAGFETTATKGVKQELGSGAFDLIAQKLTGKPDNIVSKGMRKLYDIPYGSTEINLPGGLSIPFGEESFRTRANYVTAKRTFDKGIVDAINAHLVPKLQQIEGMTPQKIQKIGDAVESLAMNGSRGDVATGIRGLVGKPKFGETLKNLGLKKEVLSPSAIRDIERLLSDASPSESKAVMANISAILHGERNQAASVLSVSPGQPGFTHWTDHDQAQTSAWMADNFAQDGIKGGMDPAQAKQEADTLAKNYLQSQREMYKGVLDDLSVAPNNPAVWDAIMDFHLDTTKARAGAREIIDAAGDRAVALGTPEGWAAKWKVNNNVYGELPNHYKELADKTRLVINDIHNGGSYTPRHDWFDSIQNYIHFDEEEFAGARALDLGSPSVGESPSFRRVTNANRNILDNSHHDLIGAFQRHPSLENFDIVTNGMQKIEGEGARTAFELSEWRKKLAVGDISKQQYAVIRNNAWNKFHDDGVILNQTLAKHIVRNGILENAGKDLKWTEPGGDVWQLSGKSETPDKWWARNTKTNETQEFTVEGKGEGASPFVVPKSVVDDFNSLAGNEAAVDKATDTVLQEIGAKAPDSFRTHDDLEVPGQSLYPTEQSNPAFEPFAPSEPKPRIVPGGDATTPQPTALKGPLSLKQLQAATATPETPLDMLVPSIPRPTPEQIQRGSGLGISAKYNDKTGKFDIINGSHDYYKALDEGKKTIQITIVDSPVVSSMSRQEMEAAKVAPQIIPAGVVGTDDISTLGSGMADAMSSNMRAPLADAIEKTGKMPATEYSNGKPTLLAQVYERMVKDGSPRNVDTLDEAMGLVRRAGNNADGATTEYQAWKQGRTPAPLPQPTERNGKYTSIPANKAAPKTGYNDIPVEPPKAGYREEPAPAPRKTYNLLPEERNGPKVVQEGDKWIVERYDPQGNVTGKSKSFDTANEAYENWRLEGAKAAGMPYKPNPNSPYLSPTTEPSPLQRGDYGTTGEYLKAERDRLSDNHIRSLASEQGIPTSTEGGQPFDKALTGSLSKRLEKKISKLSDLTDEDRARVPDLLKERAAEKAALPIDQTMTKAQIIEKHKSDLSRVGVSKTEMSKMSKKELAQRIEAIQAADAQAAKNIAAKATEVSAPASASGNLTAIAEDGGMSADMLLAEEARMVNSNQDSRKLSARIDSLLREQGYSGSMRVDNEKGKIIGYVLTRSDDAPDIPYFVGGTQKEQQVFEREAKEIIARRQSGKAQSPAPSFGQTPSSTAKSSTPSMFAESNEDLPIMSGMGTQPVDKGPFKPPVNGGQEGMFDTRPTMTPGGAATNAPKVPKEPKGPSVYTVGDNAKAEMDASIDARMQLSREWDRVVQNQFPGIKSLSDYAKAYNRGGLVNMNLGKGEVKAFEDIYGTVVLGKSIDSLDDVRDLVQQFVDFGTHQKGLLATINDSKQYAKMSAKEIIDENRALFEQNDYSDAELAAMLKGKDARRSVLDTLASIRGKDNPEPGMHTYEYTIPSASHMMGMSEPGDAKNVFRTWTEGLARSRKVGNNGGMQVSDIAQHQISSINELEQAIKNNLPRLLAGTPNDLTGAQKIEVMNTVLNFLPHYDDSLATATKVGEHMANWMMLNYNDKRNFDTIMAVLTPYSYFWSRMPGRVAMAALSKPSLVNAYYQYKRSVALENKQSGIPDRLTGTLPAPWDTNARINTSSSIDRAIPAMQYLTASPFVQDSEDDGQVQSWMKNLEKHGVGFGVGVHIAADALDAAISGKPMDDYTSVLNNMLPVPFVGAPASSIYQAATGDMPSHSGLAAHLGFGPETGSDGFGLDEYRAKRALSWIAQQDKIDQTLQGFATQVIVNQYAGDDVGKDIPPDQLEAAQALASRAVTQAAQDRLVNKGTAYLLGAATSPYTGAEQEITHANQRRNASGYSMANPDGSKELQDDITKADPSSLRNLPKNSEVPGLDAQISQLYEEAGATGDWKRIDPQIKALQAQKAKITGIPQDKIMQPAPGSLSDNLRGVYGDAYKGMNPQEQVDQQKKEFAQPLWDEYSALPKGDDSRAQYLRDHPEFVPVYDAYEESQGRKPSHWWDKGGSSTTKDSTATGAATLGGATAPAGQGESGHLPNGDQITYNDVKGDYEVYYQNFLSHHREDGWNGWDDELAWLKEHPDVAEYEWQRYNKKNGKLPPWYDDYYNDNGSGGGARELATAESSRPSQPTSVADVLRKPYEEPVGGVQTGGKGDGYSKGGKWYPSKGGGSSYSAEKGEFYGIDSNDYKARDQYLLDHPEFAKSEAERIKGKYGDYPAWYDQLFGKGKDYVDNLDEYNGLGNDWTAKKAYMLAHPEFAAYWVDKYGEDSAWWTKYGGGGGGGGAIFGPAGHGGHKGHGSGSGQIPRVDPRYMDKGLWQGPQQGQRQWIPYSQTQPDWLRAGEQLKPGPMRPWQPPRF